jgi:signal transduction histidine kinase
VLENLIDNARKYSTNDSDVTVSISTDKDAAIVEVADHGVGILKNDRQKLFKKFSRIQNEKTSKISGTGLGLYWAKHIVDLHGGDIWLAASSKSGSTFAFALPLVEHSS